MKIIPYNSDVHFNDLIKICELRHFNLPSLPRFGLVAIEKGNVVAFGFLREVEGGFAMVDGYITNPSIQPGIRDLALNRLTNKLIKIAKHNKIKGLVAWSEDLNTIVRAKEHGFAVTSNQSILSLTP